MLPFSNLNCFTGLPTTSMLNQMNQNSQNNIPSEDRYAALKDLDNAFKSQTALDWSSSGSNGSLYSSPTPTGSMYSSPSPQGSLFGSPSQGKKLNKIETALTTNLTKRNRMIHAMKEKVTKYFSLKQEIFHYTYISDIWFKNIKRNVDYQDNVAIALIFVSGQFLNGFAAQQDTNGFSNPFGNNGFSWNTPKVNGMNGTNGFHMQNNYQNPFKVSEMNKMNGFSQMVQPNGFQMGGDSLWNANPFKVSFIHNFTKHLNNTDFFIQVGATTMGSNNPFL